MPDEHPIEFVAVRDTDRGTWRTLGWAAYLAGSWTWVIGLLLPAILVRDYGFWGWLAFALPNVFGAAAFAWFIRSPQKSEAFVRKHRSAIRLFSDITIAFHLFVIIWLLPAMAVVVVGLTVVLLAVFLLVQRRRKALLITSLAVVGTSLVCFLLASGGEAMWRDIDLAFDATRFGPWDLAGFIPAAVLGFALCPYLDATFHHARQNTTPRAGLIAFALGFGVLFAAMITFSLAYAGVMFSALRGDPASYFLKGAVWLVVVHVALQIAFTLALHLRQRILLGRALGGLPWQMLAIAFAGLCLAGLEPSSYLLTFPEIIYRGFMLFYGIVFPGYVWLCALPRIRGGRAKGARVVWLVATLLALPPAFWGFALAHHGWALAAPLLLLLVARVVVELLPTGADNSSTRSPQAEKATATGVTMRAGKTPFPRLSSLSRRAG